MMELMIYLSQIIGKWKRKLKNGKIAISSSDYIVTLDKHFNTLKSNPFPKVNIIDLDDFLNLIK